jgi:hypothetical protein
MTFRTFQNRDALWRPGADAELSLKELLLAEQARTERLVRARVLMRCRAPLALR